MFKPKLWRSPGLLFPLFFILLMCMAPRLASAQSSWTAHSTNGAVKAYAMIDSCSGEPVKTYFIKFENTSTTDDYEIMYEITVTNAVTFPPLKGKVIITAGHSTEGNCQKAPLQTLRVPTELAIHSLSDLNISYTITKQ